MTRWTEEQLAEHKARCMAANPRLSAAEHGFRVSGPESAWIMLPYPVSVNRYWTISAKTREILPTAAAKAWRSKARMVMMACCHPVADGPVVARMILHPKQRKDGAAHGARMDLDNAMKIALDAMQGVFYTNDKQVHAIDARVGDPVAGGGLSVSVVALDG